MSDSSRPPKLLPLHALPPVATGDLRVRRRRGRPRRIELAPDHDEHIYAEQLRAERDEAIDNDPVVQAASVRGRSSLVPTISALAHEAASLKFDREQAEVRGRDAAMTSSRRVDALSKIADCVITAYKQGLYGVEMSPATFVLVRDFWLATITEVAIDTLPTEDAERFLARYRDSLRGLKAIADVERLLSPS